MKTKLDSSEKAIERSAAAYRSVAPKDRKRIEAILTRSRKSRNINIRISEMTLAELKKLAEREGLPYQTLVSSILHKYVTNRLVDEEAVEKSLRFLRAAE
jgi:predicted DNA binding CopG/RHH family protein